MNEQTISKYDLLPMPLEDENSPNDNPYHHTPNP